MSTIKYLPTFGLHPVASKGDASGVTSCFVARYNFSRSNMDVESRVHAVNSIASICYETLHKIDSSSLYNRLAAESKGLPSSSFEFISMLFTEVEVKLIKQRTKGKFIGILNIEKYGEWVLENDKKYLITNYRAAVYDMENNISELWKEKTEKDLRYRFNTAEECDIIFKHSFVFELILDGASRVQLIRHRQGEYQERSRRYVSGKKVPFSFYISKDMKDINSIQVLKDIDGNEVKVKFSVDDVNNICQEHYFQCLEQGVKSQSARRVIPQGMNTHIWVKFDRAGFENFIELRTDSHAQAEIREAANHMLALAVAPDCHLNVY